MGGKPSKGTPKDGRLSINKGTQTPPKNMPPKNMGSKGK